MRLLSIKAPIWKKFGNLFNDPIYRWNRSKIRGRYIGKIVGQFGFSSLGRRSSLGEKTIPNLKSIVERVCGKLVYFSFMITFVGCTTVYWAVGPSYVEIHEWVHYIYIYIYIYHHHHHQVVQIAQIPLALSFYPFLSSFCRVEGYKFWKSAHTGVSSP